MNASDEEIAKVLVAAENWVASITSHPNWWAGDEDWTLINAVNERRAVAGHTPFTWDVTDHRVGDPGKRERLRDTGEAGARFE